MTVARSTPETPSTSAWWVFEISAKRPSSRPSTRYSSHSGFERSSRWEKTRAASARSCCLGARRGQRGVAHVVLEVEARVVDPQRPAGLQRREGELLPVARDEVQPAADVRREVRVGGRRALEDRQRADVHVRRVALLREEGRVHRRQPIPVRLGHRARTLPTLEDVSAAPEKLLLAAPRGYCAGVDRAVQTVERALELYGPPVYVRKEIVHNKHVVEELRERGAIFVDELDDSIPEGAVTVFSAHGVSPAVHADAERRGLRRSTRPARW